MSEPVAASLWNRALPHDARRALFGGQGVVRVWSLLADPALPFTAVLACELEAGGSVGAHVQQDFPEIVIGVSGSGSVSISDVARPFGAGSVVELPLGQTLALANGSLDDPLRYFIIKAKASALTLGREST